jgi:hypothetical protein
VERVGEILFVQPELQESSEAIPIFRAAALCIFVKSSDQMRCSASSSLTAS